MKSIRAFTLAETLVTLLIIGIVASITIPAMSQQVNEYTLSKQKKIFETKLKEGLRQMRVDDKLAEKYKTTQDFVNELKKYFKIQAVCDNDNLPACFNDTFSYKDDLSNLKFETSNLKKMSDIEKITGNELGFDSDIVGIVLSDGTKMLLAANPDCEGVQAEDTQGNLTQCFKYIANVNGKKSQSEVGKNILTNINMYPLSFQIASTGSVGPDVYGSVNGNYWEGAKQYCEKLTEDGGGWRLINKEELYKIKKLIAKNVSTAVYYDNGCIEYSDSEEPWDGNIGDGFIKSNIISGLGLSSPIWVLDDQSYDYENNQIMYHISYFHPQVLCNGWTPGSDSSNSALCVK